MTDPVIARWCEACEDRTAHARDQTGKTDPPRVVTEKVCSRCGTTTEEERKVRSTPTHTQPDG